jgi:ATP-binding cassette subfamily B protein
MSNAPMQGMKMTNWNKPGAKLGPGKRSVEDDDYVKKYHDGVIFRRLLAYIRPYRKTMVILVLCLLVTSITQLVYPVGMTIILQIIQPVSAESGLGNIIAEFLSFLPSNPRVRLLSVGLFMALTVTINFIFKRYYNFTLQNLSQYIIADLRRDMFVHISGLSMKFYSEMPAGKLMSRITNDVQTVQMLISAEIVQAIGDVFMVFSSIVLMFSMSWQLTIYIMLLSPIFLVVFMFIARRSRVYFLQERRTIAEITGILQETISGSRTIKTFVVEEENIEEFSTVNRQNRNVSLKAARVQALLQPITQLIIAGAIGMVVLVGARFVQAGILDVALLLGYVVLAQQFISPINNLGQLYNKAQQALAAGDRILTILDTKPDVVDLPGTPAIPPIQGTIEFQNMSFRYVPDVPVLKDINLKIKPNQRIALVGFTGAGKSTFVALLMRFYEPTEGKILIDGHDITKVTMKSLRSQMGIVLQDTFLFTGTVMDNIRYGKLTATDDEVIEAAKRVGAHPFIMQLPDGYHTDVRERGGLLSIGQRQLISFARALLADPRILILDEATSSVDPYTELKIQEALEILLKGRNSFIIAHRLSTILNSDVILVMDQGRIIQHGSHHELVAQEGLYKHLYEMQFKDPSQKASWDKSTT